MKLLLVAAACRAGMRAGIALYRRRHPCGNDCRVCERLVML